MVPSQVFADEGVVTKQSEATDTTAMYTHIFEENSRLEIIAETEDAYTVLHAYKKYNLPKTSILKTKKEINKQGAVQVEELPVRLEPSLFSEVIGSLKKDEIVTILPSVIENGWIKITQANGTEGWVQESLMTVTKKEEVVKTTAYTTEDLTVDNVSFSYGEEIAVTDVNETHYVVTKNEQNFSIPKVHVSFEKPSPRIMPVIERNTNRGQGENPYGPVGTNDDSLSYVPTTSNNVLQEAYKEIGKPYVYGANGPSAFDCSSFTQTSFKRAGISLPRTSRQQATVGTTVSKGQLMPGDLVFFNTSGSGISHVGIYVGNGNMINAESSGVKVSNINSGYWNARYVTAKRVQ